MEYRIWRRLVQARLLFSLGQTQVRVPLIESVIILIIVKGSEQKTKTKSCFHLVEVLHESVKVVPDHVARVEEV